MAPAHADDLRHVLTDFTITSWNAKDGLPEGTIYALAQDGDGYLWVGGSAGLFRFDGTRFVAWKGVGPQTQFPSLPVRALCVSRDGSLWVGFGGSGGVSRIKNNRAQNYGQADGIVPGAMKTLIQDGSGVIWAGNDRGLYRFQDDRWGQWMPGHGLPAGSSSCGFVGGDGTLFICTSTGLYRFLESHQEFQQVHSLHDAAIDIAEDASGEFWITDPVLGFKRLGQPGVSSAADSGRGIKLLRDRSDDLWVATGGQGLWHVRHPNTQTLSVERATSLTGLLADGVYALLQDRDGNIWAGTTEGLNRLTPRKISQIIDLGLLRGIEVAPDGGIWIGAVDGLVRYLPSGELSQRVARSGGSQLTALGADARGTLWVAKDQSLNRVVGGESYLIASPTGRQLQRISSITSDSQGGVWLYDTDQGLLRWRQGGPAGVLAPALRNRPVTVMHTDRSGLVWIAFEDEGIAVVSADGAMRLHGRGDGFDAGPYRAIYEDERGDIWLGGDKGLTKYSDGRPTTLLLDARVLDPNGSVSSDIRVSAVVSDNDGVLWLGSRLGVIRLGRTEFEKTTADRRYQVHYRLYNRSDGIAGTPLQTGSKNAVRAKDGRLWFITTRGVTIIDPRALRNTPASAPLRIEDVAIDEVASAANPDAVLPPRPKRLQVDYTVVDLSPQTRTRFRYSLEGFDAGWTNAGGRHQAIYTNLPPGKYRFRVAVDNGDEVATQPEAGWSFSIKPALDQTAWFRALAVAAFGLVVLSAWRLHMRRVRKEFALLLGERVRFSREIHDTLLQGLVGVAVQCKTVSALMDVAPASARELLDCVRGQAERSIRETRLSIWDLRSPVLDDDGLASALRNAGQRLTANTPIQFSFEVIGESGSQPADVEQQLFRIGQEAITNVVRHSSATRLHTQLCYDGDSVRLLVTDDGRGFADEDAAPGRLGIVSMRERAQQIHGLLTVVSTPGRGTAVEVILAPSKRHRGLADD